MRFTCCIFACVLTLSATGTLQAEPVSSVQLSDWLRVNAKAAESTAASFPIHGFKYSWLREDTWDYSPTEIATILRDADKHPQASANNTAFHLRAAAKHGGAVRTTNRMWAGKAGFRHSIDLEYSEIEPFVDMGSRSDGAWSLSQRGLNLLPAAGSADLDSRIAQGFGALPRQDLVVMMTGGLHELSQRPVGQPIISFPAGGWKVVYPVSEPDALEAIEYTGTWTASEQSGRGEVRSMVMKSRRVPGVADRVTFDDWAETDGVRYARRSSRHSPLLRTTTVISRLMLEPVPVKEIERAVADPAGWDTKTGTVRDEVRGELRLIGFVSKRASEPEVYARRGEQIVTGSPPDIEGRGRSTQRAGWALGGAIVAAGLAVFVWKRRGSLRS